MTKHDVSSAEVPVATALERLARRYVWWTEPQRVIADDMPRLIAAVMEIGTWEDAEALRAIAGDDAFAAIARNPPPGLISQRSLNFWHIRLGLAGEVATARRRFA